MLLCHEPDERHPDTLVYHAEQAGCKYDGERLLVQCATATRCTQCTYGAPTPPPRPLLRITPQRTLSVHMRDFQMSQMQDPHFSLLVRRPRFALEGGRLARAAVGVPCHAHRRGSSPDPALDRSFFLSFLLLSSQSTPATKPSWAPSTQRSVPSVRRLAPTSHSLADRPSLSVIAALVASLLQGFQIASATTYVTTYWATEYVSHVAARHQQSAN